MSVIAILMTDSFVSVVSDSKLTTKSENTASELFPKIYMHKEDTVIYGVGNAVIVMTLFDHIRKKDPHKKMRYDQLLIEIQNYKKSILGNSDFFKQFSAVGICTIKPIPIANTILIDAKDKQNYQHITKPKPGRLTFYILNPPDVPEDVCNQLFIDTILGTHQDVPIHTLPLRLRLFVNAVSHHSRVVDNNQQYWIYDRLAGRAATRLIDF